MVIGLMWILSVSKMSELEIRSNFPWPSCALSNFAKWPFVMEGIQFGGLEGFLQGCKVRNHEQQKRIFGMSGLAAQQSGRAYAKSRNHPKQTENFGHHQECKAIYGSTKRVWKLLEVYLGIF